MKFEPELTEGMRLYLEADPSDRDHAGAAKILLRVSGMLPMYREIMRKGPEKMAPFIERKLREYYNFRLAKITHEEVKSMSARASAVVERAPEEEKRQRAGIRPDHDRLPAEVQAYYVEALDCLNRERETHMQLRRLALHDATCPDSEIYPWVKEILRLDDRRLKLWKMYDGYVLTEG